MQIKNINIIIIELNNCFKRSDIQMKQNRKLILLILILILTLTACNTERTGQISSLDDYDWEHNLKVPEDKKKLLSQVIENGEVIEDYTYNNQGRLISSWKKEWIHLEHSHYYLDPLNYYYFNNEYIYDQAGHLIKKVVLIEDENREKVMKNEVKYKYNDQGKETKKEIYNEEYGLIYWIKKEYDEKGRLVYKREVQEYGDIDREWKREYNKYDKVIYEKKHWYFSLTTIKEYENNERANLIKDIRYREGELEGWKEYEYDDKGNLIIEWDKRDKDKVSKIEYYYNDKGVLEKSKSIKSGQFRYMTYYEYDDKNRVINTKKIDKNEKIIEKSETVYEGNSKKVKYFEKENNQFKLWDLRKITYDEKGRLIRYYSKDLRLIEEYKYKINENMDWIVKYNNDIIWWYEFKINEADKRITIIKKNKNGKTLSSVYFKYNSLSNDFKIDICHALDGSTEHSEVIFIEEIIPVSLQVDAWCNSYGSYDDFRGRNKKKNSFDVYFGKDNSISESGEYYDNLGNKLYKYSSEKKIKYQYIYK